METLKFKCTLLSDVVLNQRAATKGEQSTLDFIPGNNFLGIVAGKIYAEHRELALDILHSGKVHFGDAHPACDNVRSLRIPASYFYPKLGSYKQECYVHHLANHAKLKEKQLKQCRNAFVAFKDRTFCDVPVQVTFSLKSAYDRENRRSKDSQMYGYEALDKGLVLYFEIEVEESLKSAADLICECLEGNKRIGRSKTAQYGLVKIEKADFKEPESSAMDGDSAIVYADGRLIFFDEYGLPTFVPTAKQLGFEGGEIDWGKSQVRTFQYSPWNFKRQSRDMDRCGIEKGSVFVIKNVSSCPEKSAIVGEFKNEGFGKVIYNPAFLKADADGKVLLQYETLDGDSREVSATTDSEQDTLGGTDLLDYLFREKKRNEESAEVYKLVNKFVSEEAKLWRGESFASQWGTIRSIANKCNDNSSIIKEIFGTKEATDKGYLTHGIAKEKWAANGRLETLESFLKKNENMSSAAFKQLVVNLSSEMAKKLQGGM